MPPYRSYRSRYRYSPYARGSRVAKKREAPLPVAYRRPVATIAKRVISHLTEKKHLSINRDDVAMKALIYYYTDPMQFMTVGTGDGQRIGSKISDCWLTISFAWNHTSTNWNGSVLRILVVRSELQLPNAASAWQQDAAPPTSFKFLFSNDFQISSAPTIGHDYVILADRRVTSERQYNTPNFAVPGVKRFKVKLGNMTFMNDTIGGVNYQKGKNVYIICGICNAGAGALDTIGTLQFSGLLEWRDA